jgi:UDP-3-O-[3-hydroxymyristoyl] glucosamine N-acyltransferase
VRCGAYSAIAQDVPDGQTLLGVPAMDARKQMRLWNLIAKLPEINQRIQDLNKRIKALESPADH